MGQNVIELNGKRYDAVTGAFLGKSHVVPKHITEQFVHGKVIDGFVRPAPKPKPAPKPEPVAVAEPKPAPAEKPEAKAETAALRTRPAVHHTASHKPEKSITLMRKATQKPAYSIKPAIKPQAPAEVMHKPNSALAHKRSVYSVDPNRSERAALTNRHHAVRHFVAHGKAAPAIHAVSMAVQPIAVQPMPLEVAAAHLPAAKHADIFEAAIARATSHEQPKHKVRARFSKRRRVLNSLAVAASFVILAGFISYLNLPQLEMRVASVRAGFSANMPGYAPTGYALAGGVKQAGGTVTVSFHSGDSYYNLTQQSSNWNSQTLLDNTLALSGAHQTVEKNGQTIYIYGHGANASWVNGGVRYDITGNAQLSKDEISSIAASL